MRQTKKLDGLLTLRFVAAMMIVMFHLALMPSLAMSSYLAFIPKFFGLGVPLFYVVSAFSLYLGYSHQLVTRDQVRLYLTRRFFRIAPLFYVMMLVYILYLYWEYGFVVSLARIATSALFVFNLIPQHVEGYVWASWSIGVEMTFYGLLPLIVFALTNLQRATLFFLGSIYLSYMWDQAFGTSQDPALAAFGHYSLIFHLPAFAAGIMAFYVWKQVPKSDPRIGSAFLAGGLALLGLSFLFSNQIFEAHGMALQRAEMVFCCGLIVVGMAINPPGFLVKPLLPRLGETSFSLYLLHPLIIGFLMRREVFTTIYAYVPNETLAYCACLIVVTAILLPAAALTYRYIEQPGQRLGGHLLTLSRWNRKDEPDVPQAAHTS